MSATLSLILIVGAAFLAAHVLFDWLARRFRIVSGAEYLVLGILLGPQVSGFMSADVVEGFGPFITLALGWTGAALGMQLYLPRLIQTRAVVYRTAVLEAVIAFVVVTGVMALAFSWVFDLAYAAVILPAVALGAIAVASASSAVSSSPLPGSSDTSFSAASRRAVCFKPKARICAGVGPTNFKPSRSPNAARSAS